MLDEIAFLFLGSAFTRGHADNTFAASALRAKRAHSRAFDEAAVGNADDTAFVSDEIFHVDLAFISDELGEPRRTPLIANFAHLLFDDREDARLFRKNVAQIFDRLDELLVFLLDLVALES